jgi:hypothetical protein
MKPPDAVKELIASFAGANLVALGERHWVREDSDFRSRVVHDPAFAEAAADIVVEFASALHQGLLDRFVAGGDVPVNELSKVWRDTQPGAWDSPVYEEFLYAVRQVNAGLAPGRRLRVLAADPPFVWKDSCDKGEMREWIEGRDRFAAALIEREVLHRQRKALLVFGALHVCRGLAGSIAERLRGNSSARWFSAIPMEGAAIAGVLAAAQASPGEPALVRLAGSPVGELAANDLFGKGNQRVKVVEGKVVLVPASPFAAGVPLREVADAGLYFGGAPPEVAPPPEGIYSGEYGRQVQRRRAMLIQGMPT